MLKIEWQSDAFAFLIDCPASHLPLQGENAKEARRWIENWRAKQGQQASTAESPSQPQVPSAHPPPYSNLAFCPHYSLTPSSLDRSYKQYADLIWYLFRLLTTVEEGALAVVCAYFLCRRRRLPAAAAGATRRLRAPPAGCPASSCPGRQRRTAPSSR